MSVDIPKQLTYIRAQSEEYILLWKSGYKEPVVFRKGVDNYAEKFRVSLKSIYTKYDNVRKFLEALDVYAVHNALENSYVILHTKFDNARVVKIRNKINEEVFNEVAKQLYDYQKRALRKMLEMKRTLLVLDTGLGKTLTTLKALEYLKKAENKENFLVIVPKKALKKVWMEELDKWNLDLELQVETIQKLIRQYKVSQKSYKTLEKEITNEFDAIVIDEAHEISSYVGKSKASYKMAKVLSGKSEYVFMLTATPIVNSPAESYGYLSLIGYKVRELRDVVKDAEKRTELMKNLLKQLVVYENVDKGINFDHKTIKVTLKSRKFREIYLDFVRRFYKTIRSFQIKKETTEEKELVKELFKEISKYISKATPFWTGFSIKEKKLFDKHPKVVELLKILDEHENEKVIVFGYHKNLELLSDVIKNRPVFIFNGSRKDDLSKFKKTNDGVLLLSIKSGGLGLNLENVDVAIFYEYWWTWVSYKQALDRIARITSENKNKIVYNLVTVPEIRFTGYELLSDDKIIDFACALLEKGFHSIDLWMSRKIIEKKKDLDSLLEGNESGKKEIVRALLQAYRQTEEKEKF